MSGAMCSWDGQVVSIQGRTHTSGVHLPEHLENNFPVAFYQQLSHFLNNLSLFNEKCGYACTASGHTKSP